jgi:hypothetical protein
LKNSIEIYSALLRKKLTCKALLMFMKRGPTKDLVTIMGLLQH